MVGQGSPRLSPVSRASRAAWAAARGLSLVLLSFLYCLAAPARADDVDLRLRVEWGGTVERRWQGMLSVTQGALSNPRPLGMESDEPGSMWESAGQIAIESRSMRVYDGLDVTVRAPLSAKLVLQLVAADQSGPAHAVEFNLAQVSEQYAALPLDERGNRAIVRRAPGDRLRVNVGRPTLVFVPGEPFTWEVQPNLPSLAPGTRLRLAARLVAARGAGKALWTADQELNIPESGQQAPAVTWTINAPEQEGVYDLVVSATKRTLQDRLLLWPTVDERRVQFIVVSPEAPAASPATAPWETLVEIDPANPAWVGRLSNLSLMPALRRGPLVHGGLAPAQHGPTMLAQFATSNQPEIPWAAYPLPISRVGQAHVVEIEFPADVAQSLGFSIVDPNAAGGALPIELDSGVYVSADSVEATPALRKHRLVFWPRSALPLLLVTNRSAAARASFGKIRLLGPHSTTFSLNREAIPSRLPRALPADAELSGRILAGYLDRPLFPENFSASQGVDPWTNANGRTLDDWHTFYEGGTRLIEYLHHVGYNGAMLSVLADGSSIYPSTLVQPTPRYDDGIFFASGQDPVRKDALELLLRLFDREQLKLIPAVQLAAPLPPLETLKRAGDSGTEGIDLIGATGTPWAASNTPRHGLGPYYNPLNERVQDVLLAVIDEIIDRSAAHPSFAGVAVQLSADGYGQFPGPDWGFDAATLDRFARETQLDLGPPGRDHLAKRVELVRTKYPAQWLAWRSQALAAFYDRLQFRITAARPGAKLYLTGADLFQRPELMRELQPALPRSASPDDVLRWVGIDPAIYRERPNIVLLRTQRLAPLDSLPQQAVNLDLNQAPDLDKAFQHRMSPGSLFFHEPQEARLTSFDAKSPFRHTYTRLVAQPSPAGAQNRRRFVHSLATLDAQLMCDGGWLLPLGQEEDLKPFVDVYRRLPAQPFTTVVGSAQPVTVRTCVADDQTYVYLVNDSPWNVQVALPTSAAENVRLEPLGARRLPQLAGSGAKRSWNLELGPYDVAAGKFSGGKVTFSNPRVEMADEVVASIDARIKDLWARAASLKIPAPLPPLPNSDFEAPAGADGAISAWAFSAQPETQATIDTSEPHRGRQSLKLTAGQAGAGMTSVAFPAPRTGRISVAVWLRVADESRQPSLRLGIQSAVAAQPFARYAALGFATREQKLRSSWSQYVFQVHDLPTEGVNQLVVRLELSGAGEVWVDDLQLLELDFAEQERLELSKLITLAEYKRQSGDLSDCMRLIEGYWPRYLQANVPLTEQPIAQRPRRAPPPAEPVEPEKKPGMIERMRRAMPDLWWR